MTRSRVPVVFLLLLFALPAIAAPCDRTVVSIRIPADFPVQRVTSWTEPWEYNLKTGILITDLDEEGMARLSALGLEYEIDTKRTADYCAPHFRLPNQRSGIPGYPCYRTVEETYATAEQIVADHPTLARLVDAGDSWEKTEPGGNAGYDMRVLVLGNSETTGTPTGEGQGKPVFFVTSAIHAREYTTAELMTRFAEYLIDNYGVDADATWLLDEHEIHLLLQTNPDGRKQAESGLSWRKNTNENYCGATSNSRGADLNRNFSFRWGCCNGSSTYSCDETYRGPSAASEPEVQAVQSYARSIFPDQRGENDTDAAPDTTTGVYLDVHSYSELVLWPWGFTSSVAPNGIQMQTLGRKLAYFNGYSPDQSVGLYPTDGTTDDFVYGDLGVPSYTFELGTDFFQDCSTFEDTILPDNLQALIYAAKVARTPYLTPKGPDLLDLGLDGGSFVAPGSVLELNATADDTRYNNSNGSEATGNVAEARCSFDLPPWTQPAPSFLALDAADGSFNSGIESLRASLATGGLAEGRHTLYCQAKDDGDIWGPVSAVFFWILDPATAPHIAGTVLSGTDGSPVEATVSASALTSVMSDPQTGAYDLMLPEGQYSLRAEPSSPDFGGVTVEGVSAAAGTTTTVNFRLQAFELFLSDDGEDSNATGWTAESPWALSDEDSSSPSHAWSDSPGGDYGNDVDSSLVSPGLDLSDLQDVELRFSQHYSTESNYDYCHVEFSTDDGSTWTAAAHYDGDSGGWKSVVLPLPGLDGASQARIRFRLSSDGSVQEDGWHLDDIVLRGVPDTGSIFSDGFEDSSTSAWDYVTP